MKKLIIELSEGKCIYCICNFHQLSETGYYRDFYLNDVPVLSIWNNDIVSITEDL